jgi:hypothetical protein
MNETYDVYFSGVCLKTADPDEVKKKVGAMFKLEGKRLDKLFSGKPVPIKRGLDMDQAVKYRVAFRDAGALVDIVPEGQPAPSPKPAPAARPEQPLQPQPKQTESAVAPQTSSGLSLADGPLPPQPEPEAPVIETPDYGLSEAKDFNLSDCAPQVEPAPIPDTSQLDLDKPGTTIDESSDWQPLEIDTAALDIDDSDEDLDQTPPVAEPNINIDGLSMGEAKQGSLEDCQQPVEPAPLPNIDHLKLDEAVAKKQSEGKAKFQIADD